MPASKAMPFSKKGRGGGYPEHNTANLNCTLASLGEVWRSWHNAIATATPCENPNTPSKGPKSWNTFCRYSHDVSHPSVCVSYCHASNGVFVALKVPPLGSSPSFTSSSSFAHASLGLTSHAYFHVGLRQDASLNELPRSPCLNCMAAPVSYHSY